MVNIVYPILKIFKFNFTYFVGSLLIKKISFDTLHLLHLKLRQLISFTPNRAEIIGACSGCDR